MTVTANCAAMSGEWFCHSMMGNFATFITCHHLQTPLTNFISVNMLRRFKCNFLFCKCSSVAINCKCNEYPPYKHMVFGHCIFISPIAIPFNLMDKNPFELKPYIRRISDAISITEKKWQHRRIESRLLLRSSIIHWKNVIWLFGISEYMKLEYIEFVYALHNDSGQTLQHPIAAARTHTVAKKRTLHRENETKKKRFTDCRLQFALLLIHTMYSEGATKKTRSSLLSVCFFLCLYNGNANHFAAIIIISATQLVQYEWKLKVRGKSGNSSSLCQARHPYIMPMILIFCSHLISGHCEYWEWQWQRQQFCYYNWKQEPIYFALSFRYRVLTHDIFHQQQQHPQYRSTLIFFSVLVSFVPSI